MLMFISMAKITHFFYNAFERKVPKPIIKMFSSPQQESSQAHSHDLLNLFISESCYSPYAQSLSPLSKGVDADSMRIELVTVMQEIIKQVHSP